MASPHQAFYDTLGTTTFEGIVQVGQLLRIWKVWASIHRDTKLLPECLPTHTLIAKCFILLLVNFTCKFHICYREPPKLCDETWVLFPNTMHVIGQYNYKPPCSLTYFFDWTTFFNFLQSLYRNVYSCYYVNVVTWQSFSCTMFCF